MKYIWASGNRSTEPDPDLLSTPYRVQTNWHVITGAPCCGKTTLIDLLADKGFQAVPETGRKYIEGEIARGRTIDEIRASDVAFAGVIKDMQLGIEGGLRPADVIFLDRFPIQRDGARIEDEVTADLLDELLARDYSTLGYGVVRVPVLPPCGQNAKE